MMRFNVLFLAKYTKGFWVYIGYMKYPKAFKLNGGKGNCLVRSRLTAIPCFAFCAYRTFSKSTPASARSR